VERLEKLTTTTAASIKGSTAAPEKTGGTVEFNPTATASNGAAAINISASDLAATIENAKTNGSEEIVIVPKITGTATKFSIELPKASISSIASDTSANLTVQTLVGNVTIPHDVLSSIASQATGSTVTVSLNTVVSSTMTADQQKSAGSDTVYDISILSGGSHISNFGDGNITVSLPYTLKDGETGDNVRVWYLNDAGELQQMTCTYNKTTGMATFTTTHLSYYVVGYDTAWTNPFSDISSSDWFYEAVKYVSQKKLMSGTSDTTFEPNSNMTRAMLVTVLYRMEGKPTSIGANAFTDVETGEWYTNAVFWASANGIVGGYGDGLFGTNDSVTREQLAAILYKYAIYKGYGTTKTMELTGYTDASNISSWATYAMKWAVAGGLITGIDSTTLDSSGTATRAQVATILMRFAEKYVK
jgi:hypothetical protein